MDTNSPEKRPAAKKKKDSSRIIIIIIILLLLGLNGWLLYQYIKTEKELDLTEQKLENTEVLRAELDSILRVTQLQLEDYKGLNDSLDGVIDEKNAELRQRAGEIEQLLRNRNISKKELEKAIDQMDKFKYYAQKYQKQVDELSLEVSTLKAENNKIKDELTVEQRKAEKSELTAITYANKLELAQKLSVINAAARGIRIRSNGKESEATKANKTEQIKLTFNFADNPVAEKGKREIFIKIIGPDGTTQYDEAAGSGKFKYEGQQAMYTVKKTVDFDNSGEAVLIYYKPQGEFGKGRYRFEMYSEKFQIGSASVELK
ncbi:MAG: hypothetical protein EXR21_04570 [Flavobacteriaceae bacterium]|nr:hypothetical protein [Flavobacteriaceae bacterium]